MAEIEKPAGAAGWRGRELAAPVRSRRRTAAQPDGSLAATALIYQNRDLEPVVKLDVVEETQVTLEAEVATATPAEQQAEEADADAPLEAEREELTAAEMEDSIVQGGRVAVQDILFEFDSATIRPESADALATIADLMAESADLQLLVVGHTDGVGDFEYNLSLSLERAHAVSVWLQAEHGISGDRLQAAGAGMMAPIASNRTEDGRTQNRRVELVEITE